MLGRGVEPKGKKRERTHGHREQCGDCRWGQVEQDIGGINGGGKKMPITTDQLKEA